MFAYGFVSLFFPAFLKVFFLDYIKVSAGNLPRFKSGISCWIPPEVISGFALGIHFVILSGASSKIPAGIPSVIPSGLPKEFIVEIPIGIPSEVSPKKI